MIFIWLWFFKFLSPDLEHTEYYKKPKEESFYYSRCYCPKEEWYHLTLPYSDVNISIITKNL